MTKILTSLLLVEERLAEASYFISRMRRSKFGNGYGYDLNAFLSASRSVTFLLQKEMRRVPGFDVWWEKRREHLGVDPAARFFLKLRNFSQKEGRISLVGSKIGSRWVYCFAGNKEPVPEELMYRDVCDCCEEYCAKIAQVVLDCVNAFPFHTCPRSALTPEGLAALKLDIGDVLQWLGYPRRWIEAAPGDLAQCLRILREQVDALDLAAIRKLATPRRRPHEKRAGEFSQELLEAMVRSFQDRSTVVVEPEDAFLSAILEAGIGRSDDDVDGQ